MEIKPYKKNQLYKGYYKMDSGGEITLPDKCEWQVRKYMGGCAFGDISDGGEIALLLHEDYGDGGGFWSVISFLTKEEAFRLAQTLIDFASNTTVANVDFSWSEN